MAMAAASNQAMRVRASASAMAATRTSRSVFIVVGAMLVVAVVFVKGARAQNTGCNYLSDDVGGVTDIADELNTLIQHSCSGCGVYCDGTNTGVLFRTPDFLSGQTEGVVPATFIHNDIITPTPTYTAADPWCATDETYLPKNCPTSDNLSYAPWNYAVLGAVVGADGMSQIYPDFSNIQSYDWGYGVFYGFDANSDEQRCRYLEDNTELGYPAYDCPGGVAFEVDNNAAVTPNPFAGGAGKYEMGNPYAGGGGGGAGCHINLGAEQVDQVNAFYDYGDGNGELNLVWNADCECDYRLKGDDGSWNKWLDQLLGSPDTTQRWTRTMGQTPDRSRWFNQQGNGFDQKVPTWAMDLMICWVNNPRDMIEMQNTLYRRRLEWNNQKVPYSTWAAAPDDPFTQRIYWGWNEVPATVQLDTSADLIDTVVVRLPTNVCGNGGYDDVVACLDNFEGAALNLECQLSSYVNDQKLLFPGVENVGNRPGSYILFLKSQAVGNDVSSNEYENVFYCENWTSPNGYYNIVYVEPSDDNPTGACYIEYGDSFPGDAAQALSDQNC